MRLSSCIVAAALALWLAAPVHAADEEAKLKQAGDLIRAGKAAEAVPIYQELLDASPGDPRLAMNLAIAEFQAGDYTNAVKHSRLALSLRPGWSNALLFLGASHLRLGEPNSAVEFLEKAVAAQPDERNARLMLGEALLQLDRPAQAIPDLEKASELLPENARVWYGLSRSYASLAERRLADIEASGRESAYWHALAGDDFSRRGRIGRAVRHYREALAMRPDLLNLHRSIGSLYERFGRKDWATAEFGKAPAERVACDASDVVCLYNAGRLQEVLKAVPSLDALAALYWEAKTYRGLADQAREKLERLPPSPQLYELEARSATDQGDYLEAIQRWHAAIALDPDNTELKVGLAIALRGWRDHPGAVDVLAEVVKKQPRRAELAYLFGDSLVEIGRPAEAVPFLEKAVAADPALLRARAALGRAHAMLGDANQAIPELEAALPVDEDGSVHYQLAMAYREAGERERSRETLARYEEIRAEAAARLREFDAEVPVSGP